MQFKCNATKLHEFRNECVCVLLRSFTMNIHVILEAKDLYRHHFSCTQIRQYCHYFSAKAEVWDAVSNETNSNILTDTVTALSHKMRNIIIISA